MHLRLTCQLGSAPTVGRFFLLLTSWDDKIQPLPLQAEDGSQNCCHFKSSLSPTALDFDHRSKILQIPFLPFLAGHPHLQTASDSEPAASGVQVDLGSGRWGQLSHIHFPALLKSQSEPPPLLLPQVGSDGGWLKDELITCLPAQLPAHLAELSVAEFILSPSNIILQLFSSREI